MMGNTASELKHLVGQEQDHQRTEHGGLRRPAGLFYQPPHGQRPTDHHGGFTQGLDDQRPRELVVRTPVVLVRKVSHGDHHEQRHQGAWQNARQEQGSHRHVGHHAVNHEGQTRRNDGPQRGRRGRHAHRKLSVIAMIFHRLDLNGAQTCSIGNRRATHASKHH
jgi:hypothetical protein